MFKVLARRTGHKCCFKFWVLLPSSLIVPVFFLPLHNFALLLQQSNQHPKLFFTVNGIVSKSGAAPEADPDPEPNGNPDSEPDPEGIFGPDPDDPEPHPDPMLPLRAAQFLILSMVAFRIKLLNSPTKKARTQPMHCNTNITRQLYDSVSVATVENLFLRRQ